MKLVKRLAAMALALAMTLTLSACSEKVREKLDEMTAPVMTQLIQGNLDVIYHGTWDDAYLKIVNNTEEDCQKIYDEGMDSALEAFMSYLEITEITDEQKAELRQICCDVYAKADYTVSEAERLNDESYTAQVNIRPIGYFNAVIGGLNSEEGLIGEYYEKYGEADFDAMTDEEYLKEEQLWTAAILEVCRNKLQGEMSYLDQRSVGIRVVQNEDDLWIINDEDLAHFDSAVLLFP